MDNSVRKFFIFFILFLIGTCEIIAQDRTIIAEGVGLNREDALQDALRNAIDKGGVLDLYSKTDVKISFAIKDYIISRFKEYIKKQEILSETKSGEECRVKIQTTVLSSKIDIDWYDAEKVMTQKGFPKILIVIDEIINGKDENTHFSEKIYEQLLKKAGFDCATSEIYYECNKIHSKLNEQDIKTLALKQGADIILVGESKAVFDREYKLNEEYKTDYNLECTLKIAQVNREGSEYSDNIIFPYQCKINSVPYDRLSMLEKAFEETVKKAYRKHMLGEILNQWLSSAQFSSRIELVIKNVEFKYRTQVLKKIEEFIPSVTFDRYTDQTIFLNLYSKISYEALAEKIDESNIGIKVENITKGRIEAVYKAE